MVSDQRKHSISTSLLVLILVLMEYGLGHANDALDGTVPLHVLILVLMEYGLGLEHYCS